MEFLVNRPERCSTQPARRQEADINIAETLSIEFLMFDEVKDFMMFSHLRLWQFHKEGENFPSLSEVAAREFTDDKRMTEDFAVLKQGCEGVY